ncbi:hypothetical protein INT82_12960 [Mannheimia haemolytica]|nr:hypothetical protein [Mannheimia haemolytica]
MFYSNNLIKHKTGLLNLAEELGKISSLQSNGNESRVHPIAINKQLSKVGVGCLT